MTRAMDTLDFDPRRLPAPLWHRSSRGQPAFEVPGGDSGRVNGRIGNDTKTGEGCAGGGARATPAGTWLDALRLRRRRSECQLGQPAETAAPAASYSGKTYNSIGNIAEFFASRGKKFSLPKVPVEEPRGKKGFRPGQKVRHPKYGEGTVYQREGEGEEAKITVQFPRFGLKKLVEKYAQLEGV